MGPGIFVSAPLPKVILLEASASVPLTAQPAKGPDMNSQNDPGTTPTARRKGRKEGKREEKRREEKNPLKVFGSTWFENGAANTSGSVGAACWKFSLKGEGQQACLGFLFLFEKKNAPKSAPHPRPGPHLEPLRR